MLHAADAGVCAPRSPAARLDFRCEPPPDFVAIQASWVFDVGAGEHPLAMSAIIEAMRAGFGPQRVTADPADGGHDRTSSNAPAVLEFLYAKYFRVRTIGSKTCPAPGRRCWWPTTRAACPTTAPC